MRRTVWIPVLVVLAAVAGSTLWLARDLLLPARLQVEPGALSFGTVALGTSERLFVIAANVSDEPLIVDSIRTEPASFRAALGSLALEPGDSVDVLVTFNAGETGPATGRLVFEGKGFRSQSIPLEALALQGPVARVDPLHVSFGAVPVEGIARARIAVRNGGEMPLEIESIATGKPFRSEQAGLRVEPGDTQFVELRFQPTAEGAFRNTVTLQTNDPAVASVVLGVEGLGVAEAPDVALSVEPGALDFGAATGCEPVERLLVLRNEGADELQITSLGIPAPFFGPGRSRRIGARSSVTLPIYLDPVPVPGEQAGELVVYSNDPKASRIAVDLRGRRSGCSAEAAERILAEIQAGTRSRAGRDAHRVAALAAARAGLGAPAPDAPGDPGAPPDPADPTQPQATLENGQIRVASYSSPVGDYHVDTVAFDRSTGLVSVDGLHLPGIDAGLGEYFQFSPTGGVGFVDALGELRMTMPVEMLDAWGNATVVDLELTTGVASTVVEGGTQVSLAGEPLGPDGTMKLVGIVTMPNRSAFSGQPMRMVLHVKLQ